MIDPTYDDFKAVFYDFESCFRRLDSLHWREIIGDSLADTFEGAFIRTVSRTHLELTEP